MSRTVGMSVLAIALSVSPNCTSITLDIDVSVQPTALPTSHWIPKSLYSQFLTWETHQDHGEEEEPEVLDAEEVNDAIIGPIAVHVFTVVVRH